VSLFKEHLLVGIFQVMGQTHATLMNELNVDPKVVSEQLGHTLDVSLNRWLTDVISRPTCWKDPFPVK